MTADRPPERPDMPTPSDATPTSDLPAAPSLPEGSTAIEGVMPPAASMALDGAIPSRAGTTAGAGAIDTPNEPPISAPPAEPVTAEPLVPPAPIDGAVAPPATGEEPVATQGRRGAVARGGLRFIQFAIGVGLFVFGIWIGMQVFQSTQKSTDPVGATAVSNGVPTPAVVQEFAHALQAGGSDAVRSSVSTDVFALLASELQRWDYATIKKVDVLSTAVDGPRTATGLILSGTTTDGRTMWINLIVHTENGQISTLR
jgi:hypothetical protein